MINPLDRTLLTPAKDTPAPVPSPPRKTEGWASLLDIARELGHDIKAGMNKCPFHADKNPSMSVDAAKGLFNCFGCQRKGGSVSYVCHALSIDEKAAKKWLREHFPIQSTPPAQPVKTEISASAKEHLRSPELLRRINAELDKVVVGEEDTRLTILLVALGGRITTNAEPTSKNLLVNDESGAGKDFVVKQVIRFVPKDALVTRKRISPTVFTYWHNARTEPEWTWDGKVFYNEDISNGVLNSDVFKVMSSSDGENWSTVVVNQLPVDILTRGKPVMIITSYGARPGKETLRRFPICHLNVTEEQTRAIIERKAMFHEKGIKPTIDSDLLESVRGLEPVKVIVPYASTLTRILNPRHVIIRTHFDRLVDYIKFSAAIHQRSREKDAEGYILATPDDYEIARHVMLKTTANIFSIPLTKHQKKLLAIFDTPGVEWWSVGDLEPYVTWVSSRTLYTELDRLAEWGFLVKTKEDREHSSKPVMVYRKEGVEAISIPPYDRITSIDSDASTASTVSTASIGGVPPEELKQLKQLKPISSETVEEEVVE